MKPVAIGEVMSDSIAFTVYGRPAQMGSKRAFIRGGRAIVTDDNSAKRKQWANAVATAAADAMQGNSVLTGPVRLEAVFHFSRPKSHFGTGKKSSELKGSSPCRHAQTPDLDKLIRCLGDAISGIVFRDDSQVWSLTASREWTTSQERCHVQVVAE